MLKDDITQAVACAKTIVSRQGITAWYVIFFVFVFRPVLLRYN